MTTRATTLFAALTLAAIPLAAAAAADLDARSRSRAPEPWRADQVQRLDAARPPVLRDAAIIVDPQPVIMAGAPDGDPADAPAQRVDPNVPTSPFRGVCSLVLQGPTGVGACTGTPISPRHILTAGHCFDWDDDGGNDVGTQVTIHFSTDGDLTHTLPPVAVAAVHLHPDFTGFANPATNDDLAIITLAEDLPADVLIYPPFREPLAQAEVLTMVGYGVSGDGASGIYVNNDPAVKRVGLNAAEQFFVNDEASGTYEVFRADFDGPAGSINCFGGVSLGNDLETSVAPGDSGGPSLVEVNGALHVWGVNTFISSCAGSATYFGGSSSGMLVNAYLPWIDSVVECGGNCDDCNENGIADGLDILAGTSADADGNGIPDECALLGPGDFWVVDTFNLIGVRAADGSVVTAVPTGVHTPEALYVGPDLTGYLVGWDGTNSAVWRFDARNGVLIDRFIDDADGLSFPADLAIGPDGLIYVLNRNGYSSGSASITRHDPVTGDLVDVLVADDPATPEEEHGGVNGARSMAIGADGTIFVTTGGRPGVARFDAATGAFLGWIAEACDQGIVCTLGDAGVLVRDGALFLGRYTAHRVDRFDPASGALLDTFVPEDSGGLVVPQDLALGADGDLHVLSVGGTRALLRYDGATGAFVETVATFPDYITCGLAVMPPAPRAADLNGDGTVTFADLLLLLTAWGDCPAPPTACPADLDGSGDVAFADVLALLAEWG